eukprot:GFYU01010692.1.p1 GENE.GFYU01010692.1~~GFYU01010692.1.p1  ORF type:complete len:343 (-),score=83.59 GFYU01010692.1:129-1157(-)
MSVPVATQAAWVKPITCGAFYIVMTTAQSFYNKAMFTRGFTYPVFFCLVQMVGILLFCLANIYLTKLGYLKESIDLSNFREKIMQMTPVTLCFIVNIAATNYSLLSLDLNVYIITRSTSIFWVMVFGYLFLGFTVTPGKVASVVCVLIGNISVALSFAKDRPDTGLTNFEKFVGLASCVGSTIANGLMIILMKKLMEKGRSKYTLEGMNFLFFQTCTAIIALTIAVLPMEGMALIDGIVEHNVTLIPVFSFSAVMAIFYQLSLIALIQNTVPLSKEIISQTKIVPQTVMAITIFAEHYNYKTGVGLALCVLGCSAYSYLCWQETHNPEQAKYAKVKPAEDNV